MCELTAIAALAALVWWTVGEWPPRRKWGRWRKGLCPRCGYDLRMHADRCPECGRRVQWPDEKGQS